MAIKPPVEGRAKGGVARAEKLSPKERVAIARRAIATRWDVEGLPRAICSSEDTPLRIADQAIDCYVLEDGTRVLSMGGMLRALGRHRRAATRSMEIPPMLQGQAFEPYLTEELLERAQPIPFSTSAGTRASGYRAELLVEVCNLYLKARDENRLAPNQKHIAVQADILIRGLATTGIIALVDEVTHYQEIRAKDALAQILEHYVAKEIKAWVKTFPNDFYANLFRLRGLDYPAGTVKRPQYFGQITNDIIYRRLAPGVLEELQRLTPANESGRRSRRLFQRLTTNVGYPKLRELLGSVVTLMKISKSWPEFMKHINEIHPRWDTTMPMTLFDDDGL